MQLQRNDASLKASKLKVKSNEEGNPGQKQFQSSDEEAAEGGVESQVVHSVLWARTNSIKTNVMIKNKTQLFIP